MERNKIYHGNNLDILKTFADNSIDSIVTDPPYGLGKEPNALEVLQSWITTGYHEIKGKGFMGKEWDSFVPQPIFWKECLRVLKPGGHLLSFAGTRTYDWVVMGLRIAGFEIRDQIAWVYASGFPKSMDIAKQFDKLAGVSGKTLKIRKNSKSNLGQNSGWNDLDVKEEYHYKEIISENGIKWQGWGTALKPALEPIVMARKPLEGTVASNVLKYGVGGINIDGCRVATDDDLSANYNSVRKSDDEMGERGYKMGFRQGKDSIANATESTKLGRFPANLILSYNEDEYELKHNINSTNKSKVLEWLNENT